MVAEAPTKLHSQRTVVAACFDCEKSFEKPPRSRMLRCDPCRARAHREQCRAAMARKRSGTRDPDSPGLKQYNLACGHVVNFRIAPVDGEDLYCVRCQDWQEYVQGRKRPLCIQRIHRLTPYQTGTDHTGRKFCKRCARLEAGLL